MGLPSNTNALQNGFAQGYQIGRSLRFRSSASAYLTRTPSVAGSQTTWTWSGWVKRGTLGTNGVIFGAYTNSQTYYVLQIQSTDQLQHYNQTASSITAYLNTTQVFRDPSAWYHIVAVYNSTNATASNRMALYVNGVQVTAFSTATYPSQNTVATVNSTSAHDICRFGGASNYFDGYLAEVNFIDGQALTPSSFGAFDTNGIWQPIKYTGTYGTNGFYLPFRNTTSTTTLVQDASGNGNNWTPNNISLTSGTTYDSMLDSPTVSNASSNYAVLNPTQPSGGTYQAGNQQFLANTAGQWKTAVGTMFATSGKYYWEVTAVALPTAGYVWGGAASSAINLASSTYNGASALPIGGDTNGWGVGVSGGNIYKYYNGSGTIITAGTDSVGDVWMVAVDIDAAKIWFGRNGTWLGSGDPATGANAAFTNLSGSIGPACSAYLNTGATAGLNCGQRPFSYTPPSGYNALNTANLPQPLISNGANYMAATLYTGTGSNITITNSQSNGGNNAANRTFYPDFVWTKGRSAATNNILIDSVRGGANYLISDSTSAEANNAAAAIQSFSSTGYVMGTGGAVNTNGATYVGWQWNAGSGTTSTNTSGSITSTVSANPSAGFSVALYTGNSTIGATVGHGLGVAPNMIILKPRNAVGSWIVYHSSYGNTGGLVLNLTNAAQNQLGWWNNTSPSSTVFTLGGNPQANYGDTNYNYNYVAYCFAAVRNYSVFGSYVGTGSSDGPFVFTNFRPRFVLIKDTAGIADWNINDSSRDPYNQMAATLFPDSSSAESSQTAIDFLSNGFKIRGSTGQKNSNGTTYIYAAFAESPFQIARAR